MSELCNVEDVLGGLGELSNNKNVRCALYHYVARFARGLDV